MTSLAESEDFVFRAMTVLNSPLAFSLSFRSNPQGVLDGEMDIDQDALSRFFKALHE